MFGRRDISFSRIIQYCFYLFIATLIAILISILEMYSAFKGRNKQNQEIEAYVNYMLESNIEYEKN